MWPGFSLNIHMDFITLTEPGAGRFLVRHAEILMIEPTAYCYSRIQISTGTHKIVEESPLRVLALITLAQAQSDAESEPESEPATKYPGDTLTGIGISKDGVSAAQ